MPAPSRPGLKPLLLTTDQATNESPKNTRMNVPRISAMYFFVQLSVTAIDSSSLMKWQRELSR